MSDNLSCINLVQWFGSIDHFSAHEIKEYLKSITNLLDHIQEYEFSETGMDNHPWSAWEFCGEYSEQKRYVNYQAAREMHSYTDLGWDGVANVVKVGRHLPDEHKYADWYVQAAKNCKYYKLTTESFFLLKESFGPVIKAFEVRLDEIEKTRRRENERLDTIRKTIDRCNTKMHLITDEGGKTKKYIHTITFYDGSSLTFSERNVFDFGVVINPCYMTKADSKEDGGLCNLIDGKYYWRDFVAGYGWETIRELTENERIAIEYILAFGGFANSGIRM